MPNTIRSRAQLLSLLATNHQGRITAQTIRDMLVSLGAEIDAINVSVTAPITVGGTATAPIIGIDAATDSTSGSMSAAHYADLEAATDVATASTLVKRSSDGVLRQRVSAVAATVAVGAQLVNATAAALNAPQYSPTVELSSAGWSTGSSASRSCYWSQQARPAQGSEPTNSLHFLSQFESAGYVDVLRLDYSVAGGSGFKWGAAAGVVAIGQDQAASGAGATWSLRAQQGFAGSVGGALTIGGGAGGTPGSNLGGDTNIELGTAVSSTCAKLNLQAAGVTFGRLGGSSPFIIEAVGTSMTISSAGIFNISSAGYTDIEAGGDIYLSTATGGGTPTFHYRGVGSAEIRTDVLSSSGANTLTWVQGVTAVTHTFAAKTSDAAAAALRIEGQGPYTSASTNKTPGTVVLAIGTPTGGDATAHGQLQVEIAGTKQAYFTVNSASLAVMGLVSAGFKFAVDTAAAGTAGGALSLIGGTAGSTGQRRVGGKVTVQAGDGGGSTGDPVNGGDVDVYAGTGSSASGGGGLVDIAGGAGGSSDGNGGDVQISGGAKSGSGIDGAVIVRSGSTERFRVNSTGIGFFGISPAAQSAAYSLTNHSTVRSLDETGALLSTVAHVLGTLIQDLQALGLIG